MRKYIMDVARYVLNEMFKPTCKHPHSKLVVLKDSTIESFDNPEYRMYSKITHHLQCIKCRKELTIKYAKLKRI